MAYAGQWGAGLQAASSGLNDIASTIMQQKQYQREMQMLQNSQQLNATKEAEYRALAGLHGQQQANIAPGGAPAPSAAPQTDSTVTTPMQSSPPAALGGADPIGSIMKMFKGGSAAPVPAAPTAAPAPDDASATTPQPAPQAPAGLGLGNPGASLADIMPKLGFGAQPQAQAAAPAPAPGANSKIALLTSQGYSHNDAMKQIQQEHAAEIGLNKGIALQNHGAGLKWQSPQAAKAGLQQALDPSDKAKVEAISSAVPAHNAVMALKAAYDATDPTQAQGILQNALAQHPMLSKYFQPTDNRAQIAAEFNSARTALASETFKVNNPGSTASPGEKEMHTFEQAYGDINTDPAVFNKNANTFAENQIFSKIPQVLSGLDAKRNAKGGFDFPQMDATYKNLQGMQKTLPGKVKELPHQGGNATADDLAAAKRVLANPGAYTPEMVTQAKAYVQQ